MNPIDKVAHCSKLGMFTSKMMLEKINCNSILFIGEYQLLTLFMNMCIETQP